MMDELRERLREWEERRERGESIDPVAFCAGWPEGGPQLARWIHLLDACDRLLGAAPEAAPPARGPEAPPPASVAGYEVRGELGRGGMGVVYLVWDPVLRREAAMKMVSPSLAVHPQDAARMARRFGQEAQVLARLKHEAIVPVYEAGLHDGRPYFVMERITGGSLNDQRARLTSGGRKGVVDFMEKVARAVAYAHANNVLHRDLKPANILLDAEGNPRITDFGLAKLLSPDAPPDAETVEASADDSHSALTAPGMQPGTAAYMAPEQLDPSLAAVGPRADVWALGIILYELLTGNRPFHGANREELRRSVLRDAPRRHRNLRHGLDGRLERVVLRCLQKDPDRRFPSATALADALRRCTRPRLTLWGAAAAGLLLAATAAGALSLPDTDPERVFARRIAPQIKELAAGRPVEVISPEGPLPPYRVRCGQGTVNVRQTGDGLTVAAPILGVIELIRDVPGPRYRIVAEIRHDGTAIRPQSYTAVGVAYAARHAPSPDGVHHVVRMVAINDTSEAKLRRRDGQRVLTRRAWLQQAWYLDAPENGAFPFRHQVMFAEEETAYYPPDAPGTWRTVTIDVAPGAAFADVRPASADRMGPLAEGMDAAFRRKLQRDYPTMRGLDGQPPSRAVVSLVVAGSECTVRRIRIIPTRADHPSD